MRALKLRSVVSSVVGLGVAWVLAAVFLLISVLQPEEGQLNPDPGAWLFAGLFVAVFTDAVLFTLRRSVSIRVAGPRLTDPNSGLIAAYNWAQVALYVVSGLLLLGCAAGLALFIVIRMSGTLRGPSLQTWILVATWVLYIPARLWLTPRLQAISKATASNLPTYTLEPDAVLIDLRLSDLAHPERRYVVRVGFDELTDLVSFPNLQTAEAYWGAGLATNLGLDAQPAFEWYRYLTGKSPKPRFLSHLNSVGRNVLLYGPDIVYGLAFAEADVTDLVTAFRAYRQLHPLAVPGSTAAH